MNRYRPDAYYLRGALPDVEQSRDEYVGSVFGAAALAYIAIIHANEALDLFEERCPREFAEARRYVNRLTGTKATIGEMRKVELAIGDQLAHGSDKAWMADFGNAAYGRVLPQLTALQTAVANALGRYNQMRRTFYLSLILFLSLGVISFLIMFFRADALAAHPGAACVVLTSPKSSVNSPVFQLSMAFFT